MRPPGYSAYIGIDGEIFCCILIFDWRGRGEFLGIDWHGSAQEIDDTIQKAVPGAYVQYFTPSQVQLRPAYGDVSLRPLTCPMMAFASGRASAVRGDPRNNPSPRQKRRDDRKMVQKILGDMG